MSRLQFVSTAPSEGAANVQNNKRMRDILSLSEALLKVSTPAIDLYKFVCKDKEVNSRYNNILTGVYHDQEGWAVATDTRTLIASRAAYQPKYSGKVIDKNGKEIKTRKFPNWKTVFPDIDADAECISVDADEIETVRTQMLERIKQYDLKTKDCTMMYKVGKEWYNMEYLSKVANLAPTLIPLEKKPASYVSDNQDLIVLVMPLWGPQSIDLDPNTYAILKNEGEIIYSLTRTASASATAEPKRKLNNPLAI